MGRWTVFDPLLSVSYKLDCNPNDGGSPQRKRTLTTVATTASDGVPLIFQGPDTVSLATIKGVGRTRAEYDMLKTLFNKRYLVQLTDDLGRVFTVVFESFSPVRAPLRHAAFRFTYTVTYRTVTG